MTSTEYIDNLTFDYIETYSFQRGKAFNDKLKELKNEYDRLRFRKDKITNPDLDIEKRQNELEELVGLSQHIINAKGQFHFSSIKTNTFSNNDIKVQLLKDILRTSADDIPYWMCWPTFRDAIVFYDVNNNIVSTLNVCLGCDYMDSEKSVHINADIKTYKLLKQFFIDIGHAVSDNEY